MCIACGWKPEREDIFSDDNPIFRYMQDAFNELSKNGNTAEEQDEPQRECELAALGYLGPMFLFSMYKAKDSELVRYHANQALTLLVLNFACDALEKIPLFGKVAKKVAKTGVALLSFLGARNAFANKLEPVPYVGEFSIEIFK